MCNLARSYPENPQLHGVLNNLNELHERHERHKSFLRCGILPYVYELGYLSNHSQLRDLIEIISAEPKFRVLTSKEYLPHLRDTFLPDYLSEMDKDNSDTLEEYVAYYAPRYNKKSQEQILRLKLDP
jgi:hypothetical protein